MPHDFALLHNGSVYNVIVADTKQEAEMASSSLAVRTTPDGPWIGWVLLDDGSWQAPLGEPGDPERGVWWDEDELCWLAVSEDSA